MNNCAAQITDVFNRYQRWHFAGGCVSLVMFIGVIGMTRDQWFWPAALYLAIHFYMTIRLFYLSKLNFTKRVNHFSFWLKLNKDEKNALAQVVSLINRKENRQDTVLTQELIDRILEPWYKRINKKIRFYGELFFVLVLQIIILFTGYNAKPSQSQDSFSLGSDDEIKWVEVNDDVNLEQSAIDELASGLLKIKQTLEKLPDELSENQATECMAEMNSQWQKIETHLQATMAQTATQNPAQSSAVQLQSSHFLPLKNAMTLQNSDGRQMMIHTLKNEIQSLARMGARFDGPGIQSKGGKIERHIVGQLATGRYHEQLTGKVAVDQSAPQTLRRFEQVPPAYRQTVYEFLRESNSESVK